MVNPDRLPVRRALISVSNKTGVVEFARFLSDRGVEILSTGGTARSLREANIPVSEVSEHTQSPEILGGRVKTLHPLIHGGILARRSKADDQAAMKAHGIAPIDLVAVHKKSGKVLFVGTKKQCSIVVKELAELNNYFYVNKRWLGGMLTNWKTISNSINRLKDLETFLSDPSSSNNISKKDLFKKYNGFDVKFNKASTEDAELGFRLIKNGFDLACSAWPLNAR